MSTMLEQAIVDAKALREAALKNAELAVIEKYAPEIKTAVESLLKETPVEAPYAAQPQTDTDQEVEMTFDFEFNPEDFEIDLEDLKVKAGEDPMSDGEEPETPDETLGDLGLGGEGGGEEEGVGDLGAGGEEDLQLQELLNMLEETTNEMLEEELVVDVSAQKGGWTTTDAGTRGYEQELELARMESTKWKEENEALVKRIKELQKENKNFASAVLVLNDKLNESILSNAKLVYCNKTLGDASLNERQKIKIVEAIASSKTVNEAKSLYMTLKTTVGGKIERAPKSLSESVNRRSNLSAILPRRKQAQQQPANDFASRMQKLAGIK